MRRVEAFLRDSNLVSQFQSFFGVEKVDYIEHKKNGEWIAEEASKEEGRKSVFGSTDLKSRIDNSKLNAF